MDNLKRIIYISVSLFKLLGLPGSGYLCIKDLLAMMTKEEVAQIITYCDETKISYKQRLSELGINAGIFSSQSHKACQIKERKTKECRTERRVCVMRISGNLSGRELKDIIIASSTHV